MSNSMGMVVVFASALNIALVCGLIARVNRQIRFRDRMAAQFFTTPDDAEFLSRAGLPLLHWMGTRERYKTAPNYLTVKFDAADGAKMHVTLVKPGRSCPLDQSHTPGYTVTYGPMPDKDGVA